MRTIFACALSAALLCGCGQKSPEPTANDGGDATSRTIASSLSSAQGLSQFAGALKTTGLATVFDGTPSYTVLAPTDDAFGKLGIAGNALMQPSQKAGLSQVLRGHVLPGYAAPADIEGAIAAANGKPVKMPTMSGTSLTFAKDGEYLTVTSDDGITARVEGTPTLAGNGVIIPIDTVLKQGPRTASAN